MRRREEVEDRLQLLRRLEAKYGKKIEELIAYQAGLDTQEAELRQQEDDLATVQGELETAFAALKKTGGELSQQRQKVAMQAGRRGAATACRPGHGPEAR